MVTREELFAAVRLIKEHCIKQDEINPNSCVRDDYKCPLWSLCFLTLGMPPSNWPDLEEGGGDE